MIIFGTSMFSKMMKWYVENDTAEKVEAFTVEREYMAAPEFCGLPVIAFEELDRMFCRDEISILVACGYHSMNDIRKKIFALCRNHGYAVCEFIHSSVDLKNTRRGEGNIILENVSFMPFVQIGSGNIFIPDVLVGHDNCIGDYNYFSSGSVLSGACTIGNNNFIGSGAVFRDQVHIGSYNLVGAGSYVGSGMGDFTVTSPVRCRMQKFTQEKLEIINKMILKEQG